NSQIDDLLPWVYINKLELKAVAREHRLLLTAAFHVPVENQIYLKAERCLCFRRRRMGATPFQPQQQTGLFDHG
ncbi:hypothetical protein, partial [Mesorhizobium sp. M0103]